MSGTQNLGYTSVAALLVLSNEAWFTTNPSDYYEPSIPYGSKPCGTSIDGRVSDGYTSVAALLVLSNEAWFTTNPSDYYEPSIPYGSKPCGTSIDGRVSDGMCVNVVNKILYGLEFGRAFGEVNNQRAHVRVQDTRRVLEKVLVKNLGHGLRFNEVEVVQRPIEEVSSSRSMPPPSLPENEVEKGHHPYTPVRPKITKRKPSGWRSMPHILGNESFERLAAIGLVANFTVFRMTVFHMNQVSSASLINIWSGVTNFAPLVGNDDHDLVVAIPKSCTGQQAIPNQCQGPTNRQFGILVLALGFLSIGNGGIRPCSLPFGVDQFDPTTDEGRKGINSFFNWYYTTFTIIMLIALTLVVYIQDSVSWVWGFGIPTGLMLCSIVLFFVGTKMYIYVKPAGSIFSGIAQALVASYKKRKLDGGKVMIKDNLLQSSFGNSFSLSILTPYVYLRRPKYTTFDKC
nr:protein NRT1/ PTR FAMILY 2.13-like [Tanacetum cinerariifolium]